MFSSVVLTNPSVERVRAALERAGMAAEIVELPGAARTACRDDLARLAGALGEPVAKADAEFVRRHELWAAAGHPHTVFRLSYPQLLRITGGREAELAA